MTWQLQRITGRHLAHRIRGVTATTGAMAEEEDVAEDARMIMALARSGATGLAKTLAGPAS